jgi:hypothetical protein
VVRKEGVADGDTTQVQADNFRMVRTKGIDDLQASPSKIDMETGFLFSVEISGSEGD